MTACSRTPSLITMNASKGQSCNTPLLQSSHLSNLSSYYKCEDCNRGVLHDCPFDAFIVIKDGVLEQGVIDKASIGAEKSESLFHRIVKDYGAEDARTFLNAVTKLLDRYMVLRGFTYAFDELEIPSATKEKIAKAIAKAEEKVNEYIDSYRKETLERLPGSHWKNR